MGLLVASGEFLCAGQLYLARLLGGSVAWADSGQKFANILVYCLGFLAPSFAIAMALLLGHRAGSVSSALARHIVPVKIATAIAMLLLVALAWVV